MKSRNYRGNKRGIPNNAAGKPKNSGKGGNMTPAERFERIAQPIEKLRHKELIRRIQKFKGKFKLDFTDDYLNTLPEDRLRHILLAALINAGKPK